jgi:predicted outer membrane repeat protein
MHEAETLTSNQIIKFDIPTSDPGFEAATGRYTINLNGPLPDINNTNLTIEGPGADKLTVRRNAGGFYRIFTFGAFAEIEMISGLTISNGLSQSDGGAISQAAGTLNVTDCAFTDNFSAGSGGGIASGTRTMDSRAN